ncbi:hypothetical protein B0H17DRAFT_722358 [Mycena rosella]|uniref:Xylanolytic transcriptional activator regulatory domain-containing protein n=1 Tax=Mycena rosella TaxID=1033263 RepID=A0AAD7D981_MYCRO|nr:hypothetical protein B0H17DRAFT_722358 [Mycena rosella]
MQPPAFGPMSFPPAGFSSPERPTLPGIHTSDSFRPTQSDYQSRSSSQPGPQPKGKRQRNPQSLGDPKDDGMEINVDEEPAKPPGICGRCKALKMKCEFKTETDPCKRCLNGGHDCITLGRKKRRTPPKREHLLNQIREQAAEIQRLMSQLAEAQLAEANIRHDQPSNSSDYGTGSSTKIGSDADIEEWISKARYIAEVSNTIGIGGPDMPKSSLVKEKNSSSSSEDSVSDDSKGALECKVEIKSEDEEVTLRERGNPPRPHSVASSNSTDRGTRAPKLEGSGNLKLEMLPFEGSPFGLMANLSLNSDEAKTPKGRGHTPTLKMENDDFLKPNPSRLLDEPILPHILTTGLVTPEEAEMLFDIYFQRMNISVSLLDPVLYTAQKTCLRSPFLFTVVCAIASRFYTDRPELYLQAMHFAQLAAGTALISGHKSVEYCQGYILMSLYPIPARRWEEDRVWLYLGLAIRIATDLNLHLPNTTKPTDENDAREMLNRTRVWLNCFNLDRSTGSQYGKAPIISNDDYMANHSEDWWRSSPYNMACDIQICAYTAEFKVMATFMAKVYSDPSHPTGLNKFVDFEGLAGETDEELKRLADKWRLVLEQADKRDVENRFRSGLLNLNCSYARLVALSFGIQHSFGKNNTDENPFLMRCLTVVMEAVTAIVQDVGGPDQKVYLRHGPIAQSVFSAFAASMLVKLLQPKFASYITTDKRQEIYGLVENVINLLASTDVSIDDKHGPNLYARFLKSLLAAPLAKVDDSRQRRRRRSNSGDSTASSHTSLDTLHSLSPAPTAAALSFDRFAPPLGGSIDPFMPLALPSGSALGIDADPSAPDFYPPLPYNQDPPLESLGTGWPDDFSWMNQLPRAEYTRPHEGMNSNSY